MALVLDIDAICRRAVDEALARAGDEFEARLRKVMAANVEQLEPLASILGISAKAACERCRRDPELRALGIRSGRGLVFKRSAVEGYLAAKGRR
jgi:hypothetical protein